MMGQTKVIPLWVKIAYTVYVAYLFPFYVTEYGISNFLWFSNIALILTVPALWLESRLLLCTQLLAIFIPEMAWSADYLWGVLTGSTLIGLADYMFDGSIPLLIRALSLYHLWLPLLLLGCVAYLGYEKRAFFVQTFFGWAVLIISYFFTSPDDSINWVHGAGDPPSVILTPVIHLVFILVLFPLCFYLPAHLAARRWLPGISAAGDQS